MVDNLRNSLANPRDLSRESEHKESHLSFVQTGSEVPCEAVNRA